MPFIYRKEQRWAEKSEKPNFGNNTGLHSDSESKNKTPIVIGINLLPSLVNTWF